MESIVIKVGSSTLTQGTKKLSRRYMLRLAEEIAALRDRGIRICLVSSGAIIAGRSLLDHPKVDRTLPSKQMFAAIGQTNLMQLWSDMFAIFDIHVGQVLLTRDDFSSRKRFLNARDTLNCLLQHKILPIINENDTVATQEIRVGDNDNLAALVSNLVGASHLILLTDQEGLYTKDPRFHKDAELIPLVKKVDKSIFALAGVSGTKLGTGGMITKIEAAKIASESGIKTIIANADHPHVLRDIVNGKKIGTLFLEEISAKESRKRWILSDKRQGVITVDKGAAKKILNEGASLLPSGILCTSDPFERGACVEIKPEGEDAIAIGMSNYSSTDIHHLIGKHSADIEDILGYSYGQEIIHRSNMTRIKEKEASS